MRRLINYFVRKRNKSFSWPQELPTTALLEFTLKQVGNLVRGTQVLLRLRAPKMMLRGRRVKLSHLSQLQWGSFLKLGNDVLINAMGRQGITLGNSVSIGDYSRLIVSGNLADPGKGIKIGNNVGIGEFAYLGGAGGLEIGNDCIAGQYLSCHPENHVTSDPDVAFRLQGVTRQGIKIGNNCWLGSKVTILDGVTIGNNCIVAAGAVVNRSFPDNCVIGGVPARLLKMVNSTGSKADILSIPTIKMAV